jgi:DMSO/TMAO reductase YedYZ molybdopterin-dependent catalytic subunit
MTIPGKDSRLIPYGSTNLGMPLDLIEGLVVPSDLFFVRSNGPTPVIDPASWRLSIDGNVERRLNLSLDDVKAFTYRTLTSFLECAGNSRSRLDPPAEGTEWKNDAAGTAVWGGTSLRNVLEMAGVKADTVDLVSQGGDMPGMQRGLPIQVALDPITMLVWEMNGAPLPVVHGGPVRLLVPRWAGIASTKWLIGLTASEKPFAGFWNLDNYTFITASGEHVLPVREMPVKSIISRPTTGEALDAGEHLLTGYAWSGYGAIARVEISSDSGQTWNDAEIVEEAGPLAWVRFAYKWTTSPGTARLRSRATDERGLVQPEKPLWNAKGYLNNSIYEIELIVR